MSTEKRNDGLDPHDVARLLLDLKRAEERLAEAKQDESRACSKTVEATNEVYRLKKEINNGIQPYGLTKHDV